jgi:signal transduction histidine kinase/PAS domain-containing protein
MAKALTKNKFVLLLAIGIVALLGGTSVLTFYFITEARRDYHTQLIQKGYDTGQAFRIIYDETQERLLSIGSQLSANPEIIKCLTEIKRTPNPEDISPKKVMLTTELRRIWGRMNNQYVENLRLYYTPEKRAYSIRDETQSAYDDVDTSSVLHQHLAISFNTQKPRVVYKISDDFEGLSIFTPILGLSKDMKVPESVGILQLAVQKDYLVNKLGHYFHNITSVAGYNNDQYKNLSNSDGITYIYPFTRNNEFQEYSNYIIGPDNTQALKNKAGKKLHTLLTTFILLDVAAAPQSQKVPLVWFHVKTPIEIETTLYEFKVRQIILNSVLSSLAALLFAVLGLLLGSREFSKLVDKKTRQLKQLNDELEAEIKQRHLQQRRQIVEQRLLRRVAESSKIKDVCMAIAEECDTLFGWDACFVGAYEDEYQFLMVHLNIDTFVSGERKSYETERWDINDSRPMLKRVINGERILLNNNDEENHPLKDRFGDTSRVSKSLIFYPIKHGDDILGVISLQSYTFERYNNDTLKEVSKFVTLISPAFARSLAAEELIKREELYRRAIEQAGATAYQRDYDREEFRFVGRGIEDILGHYPQPLTAQIWDSHVVEVIPLGDARGANWRDATDKARQGNLPHWHAEICIHNLKRGEIWVKDTSIQMVDEVGKPYASLGILQDITDIKRADREREAMRVLAHRLTETQTIHDVASIMAQESRRLFQHHMFYFLIMNFDTMESHSVYFEDTPLQGDQPIEQQSITYKIKTKNINELDENRPRLINRDLVENVESPKYRIGEVGRPSRSLMYAPVRWGSKLIGVVSVQSYNPFYYQDQDLDLLQTFTDQCGGAISRAVAMQEQLELNNKMQEVQKLESLGLMAGGIAHDFNNLLMGIMGLTEMAKDMVPEDSPALTPLNKCELAAIRASDLCNQLLAYSGKGTLSFESLNLSTLVEEMADLLKVSVLNRAELQYSFDSNLPKVRADATQIRQVVMNLITNAGDAVDGHTGKVTLSTGQFEGNPSSFGVLPYQEDTAEGRYVYAEVEDNGPGIEIDKIQKIFDPFYTTKFTGRGLGLAAVLGIMRGHGGAIAIKSQLGNGTSMRIYLPVTSSKSDSGKLQRITTDQIKAVALPGKVLVVDDEEIIRETAGYTLEQEGINHDTAADGVEALKIFNSNPEAYSIILLDYTMPFLSGDEVAEQICATHPNLPIILSSGFVSREITDFTEKHPNIRLLNKPYKPSELTTLIYEIIAKE